MAEPWALQSVAVQAGLHGPKALELLEDLDALAFVFFDRRDHDQLEPVLRSMLRIAEARLGAEHAVTDEKRSLLGTFLTDQRRCDEAEQLLSAAVLRVSTTSVEAANLLLTYARALLPTNRASEAEQYAERALELLLDLGSTGAGGAPLLEKAIGTCMLAYRQKGRSPSEVSALLLPRFTQRGFEDLCATAEQLQGTHPIG